MKSLRENWRKIIVIVLVCWIVDMLLHKIMPFTLATALAPSVIIERGWLLPVVGSALLITLGALAVVFVLLEENLPEKKLVKGLLYGISFGGLWLVGFIEVSLVWDAILVDEILNWLPDGISIILMSLLLGIFTARDSDPMTGSRARGKMSPLLVIAAFYFVGRYLAYWVVQTNAAFDPNPLAVFVWTLVMAVWVGIMYVVLGPGSRGDTSTTRALWFGGLVFGIDWVIFILFAPIFYDLPMLDTVFRSVLDVSFVVLGAFVFEKLAGRTLTWSEM